MVVKKFYVSMILLCSFLQSLDDGFVRAVGHGVMFKRGRSITNAQSFRTRSLRVTDPEYKDLLAQGKINSNGEGIDGTEYSIVTSVTYKGQRSIFKKLCCFYCCD